MAVFIIISVITTVKPPNSDHIGSELFGPCSEVGLISEAVFQIQYNVFFMWKIHEIMIVWLNELMKSFLFHCGYSCNS